MRYRVHFKVVVVSSLLLVHIGDRVQVAVLLVTGLDEVVVLTRRVRVGGNADAFLEISSKEEEEVDEKSYLYNE